MYKYVSGMNLTLLRSMGPPTRNGKAVPGWIAYPNFGNEAFYKYTKTSLYQLPNLLCSCNSQLAFLVARFLITST